MKTIFFIVLLIAQCDRLSAQVKTLSLNELYARRVQVLSTLDSNDRVRPGGPIDLLPCRAVFYRAYIDRKTRELRVIGRICIWDTGGCTGMPMDIFKAVKSNGQLSDKVAVGESTGGKGSSLNNQGFFDVRFKVDKGDYLFFYERNFYLEQYNISDIFYPQPVKKRRANAR